MRKGGEKMRYKVKRTVYTRNGDAVLSLLRKGFKLQSVAYFVCNPTKQNFTLVKFGL